MGRKKVWPKPERMHPDVDAALRDEHVQGLACAQSVTLYDALCERLAVKGEINPATQKMVRDACAWEDVIVAAQADIRRRGVMIDLEQGSQKLRCANKALGQLKTAQDQQRKIFTLLRLTPGARGRAAPEADEEEADPFEQFD